jgi:hypothetical protein
MKFTTLRLRASLMTETGESIAKVATKLALGQASHRQMNSAYPTFPTTCRSAWLWSFGTSRPEGTNESGANNGSTTLLKFNKLPDARRWGILLFLIIRGVKNILRGKKKGKERGGDN